MYIRNAVRTDATQSSAVVAVTLVGTEAQEAEGHSAWALHDFSPMPERGVEIAASALPDCWPRR